MKGALVPTVNEIYGAVAPLEIAQLSCNAA